MLFADVSQETFFLSPNNCVAKHRIDLESIGLS
jgi:hypothetical protein